MQKLTISKLLDLLIATSYQLDMGMDAIKELGQLGDTGRFELAYDLDESSGMVSYQLDNDGFVHMTHGLVEFGLPEIK